MTHPSKLSATTELVDTGGIMHEVGQDGLDVFLNNYRLVTLTSELAAATLNNCLSLPDQLVKIGHTGTMKRNVTLGLRAVNEVLHERTEVFPIVVGGRSGACEYTYRSNPSGAEAVGAANERLQAVVTDRVYDARVSALLKRSDRCLTLDALQHLLSSRGLELSYGQVQDSIARIAQSTATRESIRIIDIDGVFAFGWKHDPK